MPVTKASLTDAPELNALVNSAYRGDSSKKGWTTEADLLDGSRIDVATLEDYLNDPDTTILKYTDEAGRIKGCVYLQDKGSKLYLGMLTIAPGLQAGGLGRMLLQEAETFAQNRDMPVITMTVISTRTELIDWYERRGYAATGEILPFHTEEKFGIPRNPIEMIVMEKRIDFLNA